MILASLFAVSTLIGVPSVLAQDGGGAEPYDIATTKHLTGDWGGARTWLEDNGVNIDISLTFGYQKNLMGGLDTESSGPLFGDNRINITFDFDKMGLIPGGSFFVRGKSKSGDGARPQVGPDVVPAYALDSGHKSIYVDKWWYRQVCWNAGDFNRIDFRFGRLLTPVDLFDRNDYAMSPWDQFLNVDMCRNPIVPHSKTIGWFLRFWATKDVYVQAAVMDPRSSGYETGFKEAFDGDHEYNVLLETSCKTKLGFDKGDMPGEWRMGLWYRPENRPEFTWRFPNDRGRDDVGFYLSFNQLLWKENSDANCKQGLGGFFRYGYGHSDINRVNNFYSAGLSWTGAIPTRDADVLAFGFANSRVSDSWQERATNNGGNQTVYELYYKFKVTPWCYITPDLQFIHNPGYDHGRPDSMIAGVRFKLSI